MDEIIGHRRLSTLDCGKLATGGKRHLLERGEVVFGLGKAQPESYIRVPGTDHVRHTEGIALDANVILVRLANQRGRIRCRWLAPTIGHDQEYESANDKSGQCE
jgi:hypothetical protein